MKKKVNFEKGVVTVVFNFQQKRDNENELKFSFSIF